MRLNKGIAPTSGLGWFGIARWLKFVISVQGNDLVRFLYLAACELNITVIQFSEGKVR